MYWSLAVGLTLAVATAQAESPPLTLTDAVALARTNHPTLAAARQRVEAAGGHAQQARLWPNPELELSVEDLPVNDGGLSRSQNMIGLAQTVPFPGKKRLDAQIGRQAVSVAEREYLAREREVVRAVTAAFCRTLAAQKKAGVAEELVALNRSLVDAARQRISAGATGDQERLRAEIEQERASVELSAAQRELTEARQALAQTMGRPHEPLGPLAGELRAQVPALDVDAASARMLAQHPTLRGTVAARERAELELRRAKLEPLPDVTLGVAGGHNNAERETVMEFRVSLPLPLFDRAQGRGRETRALAAAARYDVTATEQQLVSELNQVAARLHAASEQVNAYRSRILPRAEEALKLVQAGFAAGKFGFLDLLDTQRTAAATRLTYLDKLLELNLALADLEALTGTNPKE
ncbi:TolC family protein [bacterium]|nr:TolC family protein [bacterium]